MTNKDSAQSFPSSKSKTTAVLLHVFAACLAAMSPVLAGIGGPLAILSLVMMAMIGLMGFFVRMSSDDEFLRLHATRMTRLAIIMLAIAIVLAFLINLPLAWVTTAMTHSSEDGLFFRAFVFSADIALFFSFVIVSPMFMIASMLGAGAAARGRMSVYRAAKSK